MSGSRLLVRLALVVLATIGVVSIGMPALAAGPTLTLTPNSGGPTDGFTAEVDVPLTGGTVCPIAGKSVTFHWDAVVLGAAPMPLNCRLRVKTGPPARHNAPGDHVVEAAWKNAAGTTVQVHATYKIKTTPTPTTSSPTPTRSPILLPTESTLDIVPDETLTPTAVPSIDFDLAQPKTSDSSGSATLLIGLGLGGLMIVGGGALLVYLWRRRDEPI